MDIFGTIITAGGIVYTFLDACAAYSAEAQSLSHRLKWDLRVIQQIQEYFLMRQRQIRDPRVSQEDEKLLNETAEYLGALAAKVTASASKIHGSRPWWRNIDRAMWVLRRSELQELEKELHEWTNRFDVRLLGLPPEIRTIIPAITTAPGEAKSAAPILQSNTRLQQFVTLTAQAKVLQIEELLRKSPSDELVRQIQRSGSLTTKPVQLGSKQFVLASRPFPPGMNPKSDEFRRLVSDFGELAAALNCLNPDSGVSLLKTEYYFYHLASRQFFFAQATPYPVADMKSLQSLITREPYPHLITTRWLPMNQRLRLAQKVAEAVFFLHTAGFVHKNITSSSIAVLQRAGLEKSDAFPYALGDPYLMGFDLIRSNEGPTVLEGSNRRDRDVTANGASSSNSLKSTQFDFDAFQHPDRLRQSLSKRYIKNYDLYSLGVVLLEVGMWEPLSKIARKLPDDCQKWPMELIRLSEGLKPRMGARYQRVVAWCLGLKGDYIVKDVEFMRQVLDPLEEMTHAMA